MKAVWSRWTKCIKRLRFSRCFSYARKDVVKLYELYLDGLAMPILPENLKEQAKINNHTYDVLNIGEVILGGKTGLRTWQISSVFFADGDTAPSAYREHLEQLRDGGQPFNFVLNRWNDDGTLAFNTDCEVLLSSCTFEDKAGEPGTLYYSLNLTEYRDFGAVVA